MSTLLAFAGTYLLSLFVALLAALQLGDYFGANKEFVLVLSAIAVFTLVAVLAFAVTDRVARSSAAFTVTAGVLALLAFAPLMLPAPVQGIADRSTNPFTVGVENTHIVVELIVPALIAVLVQWGLVRRRWLRLRGEDDLSLWPWIATALAGLVVLNPMGLDMLGGAIANRPTNWLRGLQQTIAFGAIGALFVIAAIECYIRARLLRRRLLPVQPAEVPG